MICPQGNPEGKGRGRGRHRSLGGLGEGGTWHAAEGDLEMANDELKRWDSAPPIGLEFGAPVLTSEQVLRIFAHTKENVQDYFRLLAQSYDRPQLLQLVDSMCTALIKMGPRNN